MQILQAPFVLAIASVPLFFFACGGRTSAATTSDSPDGSTGSSQTSTNNPVADSNWDGGLFPSTPGQIRCGDITCDAKHQNCCLSTSGDPATNGCASRDDSVCNGTQARRSCDEAADCNPGEVCCMGVVTSPPATLYGACVVASTEGPPCAATEIAACGSDADCVGAASPKCVAQQCRGNVLQTCGLIPSAECDP